MSSLRNLFWVLSLGVIAAYLFFLALGAFAVDQVLPFSLAVCVLIAMWLVHAWLGHRHDDGRIDPQLRHGRERRGF